MKKFNLNICLNDIPDGLARWSKESEKNGKTYFQATIVERKEVGKFGDTHFVKVSWKEGNEWKDQIIGSVRPIEQKTATEKPRKTNNDLPF